MYEDSYDDYQQDRYYSEQQGGVKLDYDTDYQVYEDEDGYYQGNDQYGRYDGYDEEQDDCYLAEDYADEGGEYGFYQEDETYHQEIDNDSYKDNKSIRNNYQQNTLSTHPSFNTKMASKDSGYQTYDRKHSVITEQQDQKKEMRSNFEYGQGIPGYANIGDQTSLKKNSYSDLRGSFSRSPHPPINEVQAEEHHSFNHQQPQNVNFNINSMNFNQSHFTNYEEDAHNFKTSAPMVSVTRTNSIVAQDATASSLDRRNQSGASEYAGEDLTKNYHNTFTIQAEVETKQDSANGPLLPGYFLCGHDVLS